MSRLNIKWLGHAGFRIAFNDPTDAEVERVIYVDTWLQNPKLPADWQGKIPDDADLILVTHGHFDHAASSPDLAKNSKKAGVKVVANFEIGLYFQSQNGLEEGMCEKMNAGGTLDYGFCKVSMTAAQHSSCCGFPGQNIHIGGNPGGFVINIPHLNARIYHAGDTNVFTDMELINELWQPNILMIPIGDRFTMGPEGASLCCERYFANAKYVVPMHYETFPLLTGTLEKFKEELGKRNFDLSKVVNSPDIRDNGGEWNVDLSSL